MTYNVYNLGGLNLQLNPLLIKEGELLRAVNVDPFPFGALSKRSGYITYLGTANGSAVDSLLNFTRNDGTTFFNYRVSGGVMYYSTQGTGVWTACGNGTFTAGSRVRGAVLNDTFIVGDSTTNTRHTTNGTSFTDTSAAPKSSLFEEYLNRIYAGGTVSILTYSVTGDPTNWATTGTSDSSSLTIPGGGRLNGVFKLDNRLIPTKNSGAMFRWDTFNLVDTATKLGPSSTDSFAKTEDFGFWLNRLGYFASGGGKPQLISNAIQRQIYNDAGEGIAGTTFDNAPGVVHRYDYMCAVGTVTDDLTDETVTDAIHRYNYQQNWWGNYQYNNFPTAFLSYKDQSGNQQLIFGAANGQCYQVQGTATTDNGTAISTVIELVIHGNAPHIEKKWNWWIGHFNPGCEAQIQVAPSNTFVKGAKKWINLGDAKSGVVTYRPPSGSRSRLLFVRIIESSKDARLNFYGYSYDFEPIPLK